MQPKTDSMERRILEILGKGPATPDEVASSLGIAWATAQGHLLRLAAAEMVTSIRKGRVNVYFLRSPSRVAPKIPQWAKSRPLEELAAELEGYFPKNLSAAEMVEVERRQS